MAKWTFSAIDSSGYHQTITVSAPSKTEAIARGFRRIAAHARGDITTWTCQLKTA